MTCYVADDYGFRRLRKIFYADKRDFNFDSSSVLKKLKATHCFTTVLPSREPRIM